MAFMKLDHWKVFLKNLAKKCMNFWLTWPSQVASEKSWLRLHSFLQFGALKLTFLWPCTKLIVRTLIRWCILDYFHVIQSFILRKKHSIEIYLILPELIFFDLSFSTMQCKKKKINFLLSNKWFQVPLRITRILSILGFRNSSREHSSEIYQIFNTQLYSHHYSKLWWIVLLISIHLWSVLS